MKSINIGKLFGLQISFIPLVCIGIVGIWLSLSLLGSYTLDVPLGESVILGFAAMLLHYLLELIHSLGHAIAAKWTGYPMVEIRFGVYGFYAQTIYPIGEPQLSSSTHIIRALGGPIANLILAFILFPTLSLWQGNWYWVGMFVFLDNLIYIVQVFIPLGFNDASTILNELRKKK
ncbi:MAG: hypothetical protein ACK40V_05260 [Anaerolineales bacterium]